MTYCNKMIFKKIKKCRLYVFISQYSSAEVRKRTDRKQYRKNKTNVKSVQNLSQKCNIPTKKAVIIKSLIN